ncbi:hypothetical protein SRABI118_01430 [Massilia sp. Bi118]|uniref:lysozyme inhibitor LprI family protein n=1 Tax=Massilia sp. Bi118 TaxID=2822346 RepID=UPI001E0CFBA9|nr:lysozyme inhibitor LprI family protein [Massilia sp. Bi118]CAH0188474.1 hypothetical protein SRABI118_01430 [Massilia sp. Bi118]
MTSRAFASLCRALLAAMVAFAASAASAAALDCKNAMSTPDMNECAAIELKGVEAKLNEVYRQTLKTLDAEGKESVEAKQKLITAQRAWVKFREADCAAVYQRNAGGTIRTLMHIGCMQGHAETRMKALKEFVEPD